MTEDRINVTIPLVQVIEMSETVRYFVKKDMNNMQAEMESLIKKINFTKHLYKINKVFLLLSLINLLLFFCNDYYRYQMQYLNGIIVGAIFMLFYVTYSFKKHFP